MTTSTAERHAVSRVGLRWLTRLLTILAATCGALCAAVLTAPAASADGLDDWTPRDTSGIPITDYRLSFNNGAGVFGAVFTPDTTVPAALAYVLFAIFLASAWIGFMTLNILLLADWLSPLVRTIDSTANRLYEEIGLPFILFIVTATLLATAALWFLRNQGNRLWHHTAVTVVCVIIGSSIAFPVAEAAKMLGIGRDAAVGSGSSITGGALDTSNPTGVLINEWVRKPVQRWTFGGQDMDSLRNAAGKWCGEEWNERIRDDDPDKIKDAPLACPGGQQGQQMHDAAMNPQGAIVDSAVSTIFGVVMMVLLVTVVVTLIGVSVVALIHAGLIKLGMMGAGFEPGQNFLIRNSVDAPIAGVMFFAGLLGVFIAAAVAKILAQVVPSSTAGMLLNIVILASAGLGIRKVIRNLKMVPRRVSRTRGAAGSSGSAIVRAKARNGRALAGAAVNQYKTRRAAKRTAGLIAAAVAPEIAAPTAAAARVRAAAQRARRGGGSAAGRAAQTAGAAGGGWPASGYGGSAGWGPAYVAPGAGGGGWMAVPLPAGQYARVAASQYRTSRAAMHTPSGQGPGQRVAGRTRRSPQHAMAAGGPAGASNYGTGASYPGGGYVPAGGPAGPRNGPSAGGGGAPATSGGGAGSRRTQGPAGGGVRSASGTADAARNMARTYRNKGKS